MLRRSARPEPQRTLDLATTIRACPAGGRKLWATNKPSRSVVTFEGLVRPRLQVRACRNPDGARHRVCLRPEQEGRFALPQQEFGLDVIALVGRLRHAERRSVPEIHAELVPRGVPICERSVSNLMDRYDELLALACADPTRLRAAVAPHGRAILAIDGLQPDVGHEVLWVIREVLTGEVLLVRSLLSSTRDDLATLLTEVKDALGDVPIAGVVSDGQMSIRKAVAVALPGVPHQLAPPRLRRHARTDVAVALPGVPHQLGHFHVIQEINKLILDAVRRMRTALNRRGQAGRKKKRGRKGAQSKTAAARRGLTVKERAHFVFKHRYLIVKRRENLTESERGDLTVMREYLPDLSTLRRFADRIDWLFDTPKDLHQAGCRRAAIVSDTEFQAVPELVKAMEQVDAEKFPKRMAYLKNPLGHRVRTNNHVERTNRMFRVG